MHPHAAPTTAPPQSLNLPSLHMFRKSASSLGTDTRFSISAALAGSPPQLVQACLYAASSAPPPASFVSVDFMAPFCAFRASSVGADMGAKRCAEQELLEL